MPQLDPSSFTSQIFWLLICFFAMMFIMSTFIIPKIADITQQRANKIDGYLHKAEQLQSKTQAAIDKYETALKEASTKASEELQKTKDELDSLISKKQNELDKKLQKQIQSGEEEISAQKQAALKEIKNISAALSMEILSKLDINDIKLTEIKKLIEQEVK